MSSITTRRKVSPTKEQLQAADPARAVWVMANAGSGKTHVLVNRVVRLLLAGNAPQSILCLTFTKAAAAEMAERLSGLLAGWISLDDAALRQELAALGETEMTPARLARARRLFALAIETPGGLKIQTIHAFCEKLLQLFPAESGIAPGFAVLDDTARKDLLKEAYETALREAADAGEASLALIDDGSIASGDRIDELAKAFFDGKAVFRAALDAGLALDDLDGALRQALGCGSTASLEGEVLALDRAAYALHGQALAAAPDHYKRNIGLMLREIAAAGDVAQTHAALTALYFTAKGEARKGGLYSTKTQESLPATAAFLDAEQARTDSLFQSHAKAQAFARIKGPAAHPFIAPEITRTALGQQWTQWHADVELAAADGAALGFLRGVCLKRAPREVLARLAVGTPASASDLNYAIEWQHAADAVIAAPQLTSPADFAPALRESFASLAERNGMDVYDPLLAELDRLSLWHVADALRTLGFDERIGRRFAIVDEAARLRVVPRHARLFGRLLEMLEEAGVLRREGAAFTVLAPLPVAAGGDPYPPLLQRFAPVDGELLTLRRCGPQLARVLGGQQDPLQLLFPGGSLAEARKLYVESPFARTYNGALADALSAALARIRPGTRLRILEIGAGTGGTTTFVLPLLPAGQCEYTFTDVSPLFLERAAEHFGEYGFVRRELLDIERDPVSQGFEAGAYDVVIAANVLHATADLRATVGNAAKLLARGGLLLLLEGAAPQRWVDLTFGLTEGWWRFTDTGLRPCYPLIGREAWIALLKDLGFTAIEALPAASAAQGYLNQQVLLATRASGHPRDVTIVGDPDDLGAVLAARLIARGDRARCVAVSDDTLAATGDVVYLGALPLAAMDPQTRAARDAARELAGPVESRIRRRRRTRSRPECRRRRPRPLRPSLGEFSPRVGRGDLPR